ncbi:COMPASS component SWD1 [Spathaspora sp. JA1]|nr:COMPASS component SWD1 [Spathaspora sp. JA1]
MNLSLQDPFSVAKEYPENLSHTLQYGHSVILQFTECGDYLASGLADGSIIVYDSITMSPIVHLNTGSHVKPITSLNWSKCGRYLLSSSQDWYVKLWDLSKCNNPEEDSVAIRQVKFDGPIWGASLHPNDPFVFVASLFDDSPVYVDMHESTPKISSLTTTPLEHQEIIDDIEMEQPKRKDKHMTLVTTFTHDGGYIFTGTSKGWINIFETSTLVLKHSIKIANSNIKHLVISSNGCKLAVNSSDRIIRQINLPDLINITNPNDWEFEIDHKYQDVVNRVQWNSMSYNHNGDFLVASTYGQQSSHDLYIWETNNGSLIKILEGAKEELIDVKWNYPKCIIGSIGLDSGAIYIWSITFPQKWSALAPDFVEIEENIEYIESEQEFDIIDDNELTKQRLAEEEDFNVDVINGDLVDARGFDVSRKRFIIPIAYQ